MDASPKNNRGAPQVDWIFIACIGHEEGESDMKMTVVLIGSA